MKTPVPGFENLGSWYGVVNFITILSFVNGVYIHETLFWLSLESSGTTAWVRG